MAYDGTIKEKALRMRKSGESIAVIASSLEIPKATVSYWCRDVMLSVQQMRILQEKSKRAGVLASLRLSERARLRRLSAMRTYTAKGAHDVGALSRRDLFMVGLGLYWGEGYKKGSQEFGFSNSDPTMVRTYIAWLESVFGIDKKDLILRVSINNIHAKRETHVLCFWERLLGVPRIQFTKTSFIKSQSRKVFKNSTKHYGTLRIKVRRGAALRVRVLGAIAHIGRHYS